MQARVETAIDGGTVEIVYTTDPRTMDGLTQTELIETILGLIPAVIAATTYPTFDSFNAAEALRDMANLWDPPEQKYTYYEGQH